MEYPQEDVELGSVPSQDKLSQIGQLGQDLFESERDVVRLEAELKQAKIRRDRIATELIPEALDEAGLEGIKGKGFEVEIKDDLSVRPAKARRPEILEDLRRRGLGALVKHRLIANLGRDVEDRVEEIEESLRGAGVADVLDEEWVEPSTLRSRVRRWLEKGEEVDLDLYGVYRARRAVFKSGAPSASEFEDEEGN